MALPDAVEAGVPDSEVDCEVWYVRAAAVPEELVVLLNERDLLRRGRLRGVDDRRRFVAAWALTRLVLADRWGGDPSGFVFDRTCRYCGGDHGKPKVVDPVEPDVDISVSHTGELAVLAVTSRGAVGVDVEDASVRESVGPHLESSLSEFELRDFRARGGGYADFVVRWTRKEAVLKAVGKGLAVHPAHVEVTGSGAPPRVLALPAVLGSPDSYSLIDAPLPAPYRAAVAVVGRAATLLVHDGADLIGTVADRGDHAPSA
ncbi:4'-phosphopantetheinyl transferase family protein [Nonomuraea basaltis]|uniref:4'-phosphopantetheinyl transferase family protein n=1 Tax=Nonomuraea basaltis TaxID=2495887 RepID=UPI0014870ECE|nr:4'-phosphopantetheinyl transferase superfamily protein [Nonomuraea basaltis]